MISGRDFVAEASRPDNDAGALVSENDRLRNRKGLIAHGDVGVADAGRDELHEDFVVAWLGEIKRLDRHRRGRLSRNRSFNLHRVLPFAGAASASAQTAYRLDFRTVASGRRSR